MLDREIVLTGKYPEKTAHKPAAGVARVKHQRAVHQSQHGTDILAEMLLRQHKGRDGEDFRIVLPLLERPTSQIGRLAAGRLRVFGPSVVEEPQVTDRSPGQCWPVMPIDRDRLVQQAQSLKNLLFSYSIERRERTQIEVVGAEVGRRPRGGATHLGPCSAGSITPAT